MRESIHTFISTKLGYFGIAYVFVGNVLGDALGNGRLKVLWTTLQLVRWIEAQARAVGFHFEPGITRVPALTARTQPTLSPCANHAPARPTMRAFALLSASEDTRRLNSLNHPIHLSSPPARLYFLDA